MDHNIVLTFLRNKAEKLESEGKISLAILCLKDAILLYEDIESLKKYT